MTCFSESYREARSRFCAAAKRAGARLVTYPMADLHGIDGEDLAVDVAVMGDAHARRAALVVIGTHGAEAFAGSAVLLRWLDSDHPLPPDLKLVLVHGANPWAFSHMTRTTENNVDLNRNFLASWEGRANPAYDQLAPYLHLRNLDATEILATYRAFRSHLDRHGWMLENEMIRGQTGHPHGLFYAGTGPEWANLTFRQILRDHLSTVERIGFIDFHTGVGAFGEVVHLLFAPPGSSERQRALGWWGLTDEQGAPFAAGSMPRYEGLLCGAIRGEIHGAQVTGAVIEFGTEDHFALFRSDCLDRWLRFDGQDDPEATVLRRQYRDSVTLPDLSWRRLVLKAGPDCMDALARGVADWQD